MEPELVPLAMLRCEKFFRGVEDCSSGMNDVYSVFELCADGRADLWVVTLVETGEEVAAFATEKISYPRGAMLRVWAGRGTKELFERHLPDVEEYARGQGLAGLVLECPPAIAGAFEAFGPVTRVVLERGV